MDVRCVSSGPECSPLPRSILGDRQGPLPAAGPACVERSVFADRWLVLEHVDGTMPGLCAAALLSRALRVALMSGYDRSGQGGAIPTVVSGHKADGSPAAEPHLAIAPLSVDTPAADVGVSSFALIPPCEVALLVDPGFQSALRAITPWNAERRRRELRLVCTGFDLTFAPLGEGGRRESDTTSYVATATTWATCTPIVLDRHLKAKGDAARIVEIERLMCRACRNIGLPEPARIVVGNRSTIGRAPPARGSNWRLPKSLGSRQLTHAVLQFARPVRGPVILGAGRFVGLGLCRPLDPRRGVR
jgi:CRISPR-associated protein Csb2